MQDKLQPNSSVQVPLRTEKTKKSSNMDNWLPYVFIAPAIILIGCLLFYPLGNVFYYSLQEYNAATPYYNGFVGLGNFQRIFTEDKHFIPAILTSFKWVLSEVSLQVCAGMAIALVMNQKFKGRTFIRAAAFTPWAISGVLTSVIWSLMYNEHMGVFNDICLKLGLITQKHAWLADVNTVFPAVVTAELWRGIPFFAITILSALQSIPDELYEAAKVDGASRIKTFTSVTLPQLKNTLVLTTLLRCVWEWNNVDLIFNLTGGGPAYATTTLTQYVAGLAIREGNFGYGSAISVISFIFLLVFAITYLKINRMERGAEG